jgi:hypothetical protein
MKKAIIYLITIIISASIPIYFLLIWEPLKSTEVIGDNIISDSEKNEVSNLEGEEDFVIDTLDLYNGVFSKIDNMSSDKNDRLNVLMRELSIVDMIKINNYFSDLSNKENVNKAFNLIKKRMSNENYEEFENIIKNYIDFGEIDEEI